MDHIDSEIKQCQATQRNCAIIFVDVDRFKCINDTWGHGAGDEVLHFVGQQLRACVRQEDYVGRYGGEEFAILLIDIEQREAFELAWRLRDAIAAQPYTWQVDENRAVAIPVTASFGLSVYPPDGVTRKELIERADAAMYVAKHGGRNRVCLPDEEVPDEEAVHDPHPTRPLQTLTLV
jgi:diguanylate cyclase (GGDEF)-like protein